MSEVDESKLSEDDLERVRKITTSGIHAVERKPFRPFRLLAYIVVVMTALSFFSIFIADLYLKRRSGALGALSTCNIIRDSSHF